MYVIKRDDSKVAFDFEKIKNASGKAFVSVSKKENVKFASEDIENFYSNLQTKFNTKTEWGIEEIQDIIVIELHKMGFHSVGIAFTKYRERRNIARGTKRDATNLVDSYLNQLDDMIVHENSSTQFSLQGLNNHVFSTVSEHYWLSLYSDEIKEAYHRGRIHIHDLSVIGPYCQGWDLLDILKKGFGGVPGKPSSGPPKHFSSALNQANNFIFTLQGEAAGAMAFSNFNTLMAPFVFYDDLSYKEVRQEIQEFIFNLNISTRVGFQAPFSNITLDLDPSKTQLAKEWVIVGGEMQEKQYKDFKKEAEMINLAILDVMEEGDKDGAMLSYPIITFNVSKDFPWENEFGQNLLKATAKFGSFYFSNYINSEFSDSDITSMCPVHGNERVLIKIYDKFSFIPISNVMMLDESYKVFSDGKFVTGKFEQFENQQMIKVTLKTGQTIRMSENHLNWVKHNIHSDTLELTGKNLKVGDFLPFSTKAFPGEGGSLELGYIIGAYISGGKIKEHNQIDFECINENSARELQQALNNWIGIESELNQIDEQYVVSQNSIFVKGMCDEFSFDDVNGNRYFQDSIYGMNERFKCGLLKGLFDFNNSSSILFNDEMTKQFNMLCSTLGILTTNEPQDSMFKCSLIESNTDFTNEFESEEKIWVEIVKIEEDEITTGYCFTILDAEPSFTLGSSGVLTHNCRLRIDRKQVKQHSLELTEQNGLSDDDYDVVHQKGHGFFGAAPKTGSIGVVTLGLPSIMYDVVEQNETSNNDIIWENFISNLKYYMDISMESLNKKRKVVESLADKGLYPYTSIYLEDVKKRTGQYFAQHFSTICPNGFHETLIVMGIKDGMISEEGQNYAKKMLKFMNDYSIELQKKHRVLVNIEQSPAESAGVKLCRKSKVDPLNNGYYTNSTWFPADHYIDIQKQIHIQGELNEYYSGGSSMHTYTDADLLPAYSELKNIILYAFTETKLPYMTISPVFSVCEKCGRISGRHDTCPKCGTNRIETYSRVVGYYRSERNFNDGRKKEAKKRVFPKII